jgi:hypothetical protein
MLLRLNCFILTLASGLMMLTALASAQPLELRPNVDGFPTRAATQQDRYALAARPSDLFSRHPLVDPSLVSFERDVCGRLLIVELMERFDQSEVEGLAMDEGLRPLFGSLTVLHRLGFDDQKVLLISLPKVGERATARLSRDLRQLAFDLGHRIRFRSSCRVAAN